MGWVYGGSSDSVYAFAEMQHSCVVRSHFELLAGRPERDIALR